MTTIKYNLNPSSQLLFEDALKKCINKYGGSRKPLKSKYAPRNKHSPFGDFPASYMPKKNQDYKLIDIESHQVANAVSNFPGAKKGKGFQRTGAFSSLSKGTTDKPPKAGAFQPRPIPVSDFRLHYDRGDLPVLVKHECGTSIQWKDDKWDKFNYQLFLPIFVDGIREVTDPYRFIAIRGTFDILDHIGENVVKVIPQLIIPLKIALNTRDVDIICVTLKVIQKLVDSSELAGEALVPYYRQLLPIFNLYRNYNKNLGDTFELKISNCLNELIRLNSYITSSDITGGNININSESATTQKAISGSVAGNGIGTGISINGLVNVFKNEVTSDLVSTSANNVENIDVKAKTTQNLDNEKTEYVAKLWTNDINKRRVWKREWFDGVIYMPFEFLEIPIPKGYVDLLDKFYGNWHVFVQGTSAHGGVGSIIFDTEKPYTEYIK